MSVQLEYVGRNFYPFDDHTYRWVDVKRLAVDGIGVDREIIAALLEHIRYRDHYISSDSQDIDCGPLHGPYRLDAITPEAYESITETQAAGVVAEFARLEGQTPPPDVSERIATCLDPLIRSARGRYRLRHLPDEARHEFGHVLWEFRELLLIDPAGHILTEVVMAID